VATIGITKQSTKITLQHKEHAKLTHNSLKHTYASTKAIGYRKHRESTRKEYDGDHYSLARTCFFLKGLKTVKGSGPQ
jgi:hypothetical protein